MCWARIACQPPETETLLGFVETQTRCWCISRPSQDQDVETETTSLLIKNIYRQLESNMTSGIDVASAV